MQDGDDALSSISLAGQLRKQFYPPCSQGIIAGTA